LVSGIKTKGSTNLWAGVEKGAEILQLNKKAGAMSRLFLFSDGLVNEGIKDKSKILELTEKSIYTELDIKVSAFGLGSDFDENIMKGIAEKGRGSYFFIEGSNSIPQFVSIALKGVLNLLGSDAILQIRGQNGSLITKVYGHKNLIKGAELGDLSQNDTRRVVCEVEVKPTPGVDEEVIATYILKYRNVRKESSMSIDSDELPEAGVPPGEGGYDVIEGVVKVKYTDKDAEVYAGRDVEVHVAVVVKQTAEMDDSILELIENKDMKGAIAMCENQIEVLGKVLDLDKDEKQHVGELLKQAKDTLETLKTKKDSAKAKKEIHHRGYMKYVDSADYASGYFG